MYKIQSDGTVQVVPKKTSQTGTAQAASTAKNTSQTATKGSNSNTAATLDNRQLIIGMLLMMLQALMGMLTRASGKNAQK